MAVGSEPEIGVSFGIWKDMTDESKEKWFEYMRGLRERGNLLEGYATLHYPPGRPNYEAR